MWRVAFLLLAVLGAVHAQDDDVAREEVRKIYRAWQKGIGGRPPPAPEDATPALHDIFAGAPTVAGINAVVFAREFAKLPFDGWDSEADAALVQDGLRLAAQHAYREGMAEAAVEAGTLFLKRHPEHVDATRIRAWHQPAALVVANRYEEAAARLAEHAGSLKRTPAARAWTLRGDLAAARGTFDEAVAHYARAREGTWNDDELDVELVPKRLRMRVTIDNWRAREGIEARNRLIWKRLPKFEKLNGIGPVAQALAKKPRVILLFFFSPSDSDHFRTLLELDRMARRVGPERLSVLAVTWYESLTEDDERRWLRMPNKDEIVYVEPRKFRAQLIALRKELALSFPLATVKEKHAAEWIGDRKSLLVATDAQRRVAYVAVDLKSHMDVCLELALVRAVLAAQPDK